AEAPRKSRRLKPLASSGCGCFFSFMSDPPKLLFKIGASELAHGDPLAVVRRCLLATFLALVHQRRALVFVVVGELAVEAVVTLVGVDPAVRVDGLDLAFAGAQLA